MKYCPKCGYHLKPTDKFCRRCGQKIAQSTSSAPSSMKSFPANQAIKQDKSQSLQSHKLAKHQKLRNNCLIIIACVLVLAAAGMVFFTLQSSVKQKNDEAAYNRTIKNLGFEKANSLSPKDTAGLAISFAHIHFKNNPNWDDIFTKAENGDIHIQTVPEYQFGTTKVKAPDHGAVYVINKKTGYVVSDVHRLKHAKITFINRQKPNKEIFFPSLARTVQKNSSKDDVQKLVQQINVNEQNPTSQDNESGSDSDVQDEVSWDAEKEQRLADFMDSFGHKMKQKYEEYDGENSIKNIAGEKYPDEFDNRTFKLYSEGDDDADDAIDIDIGWDPELKKDYDYHCVAIFNCDVGSPEQHITYLFCIIDSQPVVLVDQTTNGDDCMVKETANKDVKNAFASIATGQDSDDDSDDDE